MRTGISTSSSAQIQILAHNHRNKIVQGNMALDRQSVARDYPEEMEMDELPDKEFKIRELQENAETHLYYV